MVGHDTYSPIWNTWLEIWHMWLKTTHMAKHNTCGRTLFSQLDMASIAKNDTYGQTWHMYQTQYAWSNMIHFVRYGACNQTWHMCMD